MSSAYKKEQDRLYYLNNKDKIKEKSKKRRKDQAEIYNERARAWYQAHKSDSLRKIRAEYMKNKRNTDINFRIAHNLRVRINDAVKNNRPNSCIDALGITVNELRLYLESKFSHDMNWNNYGKWHIDHIMPLCKFDLTNKDQFDQACNYKNLQPLWATDNLKKNRNIEVKNARNQLQK